MADDDEYSAYTETRQRRIKVVAWVVIISLILVLKKRSSVETVRHIDGSGDRVVQRESRSDIDPML